VDGSHSLAAADPFQTPVGDDSDVEEAQLVEVLGEPRVMPMPVGQDFSCKLLGASDGRIR
jgi:hypothetical protein